MNRLVLAASLVLLLAACGRELVCPAGQTDCDGIGCAWREYCLALPEEHADAPHPGTRSGGGR